MVMIEKMKFLSITGPKADIDRMTETYLSKYEIHLENALSELTEVANLSPFLELSPILKSQVISSLLLMTQWRKHTGLCLQT